MSVRTTMARWRTRIAPWVRRVVDLFPLTRLGLLLIAGSAFALFRYGIARMDLILLVVGLVGLGLAGLALLATVVTAVGVHLSWRRRRGTAEALRIECDYPAVTGFSMPTLWWVPFVRLSWRWEAPVARVRLRRRRRRLHEEVLPLRRGAVREIVRRFEVRDTFGLARIAWRAHEERAVTLLPSVGALEQMEVVRSLAGGDAMSHPDGPAEGEPIDMRRYNAGDPIKFVLWKVFARSRQLVVRTPERAISPSRQTVAYLVAGDDDEAAAGAARVALGSGALGADWALGADGDGRVAKQKDVALDVLARSGGARPEERGAGLGRFLEATSSTGGRAMVFVPPRKGPWVERVLSAVRARARTASGAAMPVELVVCTDGIVRSPRPGRLSRLALRATDRGDAAVAHAEEVRALLRILGAARVRVVLVDRRAGRVFADAALEHRGAA